jgi:hypothetical protein
MKRTDRTYWVAHAKEKKYVHKNKGQLRSSEEEKFFSHSTEANFKYLKKNRLPPELVLQSLIHQYHTKKWTPVETIPMLIEEEEKNEWMTKSGKIPMLENRSLKKDKPKPNAPKYPLTEMQRLYSQSVTWKKRGPK